MLGEMWGSNFLSVSSVNGKGALMKDPQESKLISVPDLTNVMQFELDNSFIGFQPHYHYEVKPLPEFGEVPVQ
jgi:hypothetical protein